MAQARKRHPDNRSITYAGFLHLPTALTDEPDFISLSGSALKLLVEIGRQYNGINNGDLCASMTLMRERGWNSNHLLTRAKKELLEKNLIIETKVGGMGIGPSLYAISWQPINPCGGKLDVKPTLSAPRKLKVIEARYSKLP